MPNTRTRRVLRIAATIVAVFIVATVATVLWSWRMPEDLGLENGRLRPCPSSPNCVCSQDSGRAAIAPIELSTDIELGTVLPSVANRLGDLPGASVITVTGDYLHMEFATPVLQFKDDVEFFLDTNSRTLHVRSASRVGYSDLGKNRERVEQLRELLGF